MVVKAEVNLGWRLIKEEKQLVFAKFMGAMSQAGEAVDGVRADGGRSSVG